MVAASVGIAASSRFHFTSMQVFCHVGCSVGDEDEPEEIVIVVVVLIIK